MTDAVAVARGQALTKANINPWRRVDNMAVKG
jgi:hypothetical protein